MKFVDRVRVLVRAGDGGDGSVAWRREAHVPKGGPAGGDGGGGGNVVLEADDSLSTLLDLRYRQHYKAEPGRSGQPKGMNGRGGNDLVIRVPIGSAVFYEGPATAPGERPPWKDAPTETDEPENVWEVDADGSEEDVGDDPDPGVFETNKIKQEAPKRREYEGGETLGDLTTHGERLLIASGGRGGRGNIHFRSSTNRSPDRAEAGTPGEAMWLRLELKLLADVGIVGFPNVGKSTLISRISRAKPEIADYPFTTLTPQLGVVSIDDERTMVVADVPGLVRGASSGRGLGHQFLRHLERTKVLLHVLAPDPTPGREPLADLEALERELVAYGSMFDGRPRVVALNKIDSPEGAEQLEDTRRALAARNIPLFAISAHTGEGLPPLLEALWRRIALVQKEASS